MGQLLCIKDEMMCLQSQFALGEILESEVGLRSQPLRGSELPDPLMAYGLHHLGCTSKQLYKFLLALQDQHSAPICDPELSSREKRPGEGLSLLLDEMRSVFLLVILFNAILAPGSHVSAGKSKDCQSGDTDELDPSIKTRFPLSRSTASTELDQLELKFVDQIGILDSLKRTKSPPEILSSEENLSETGVSLFATQTMELPGLKKPSSKNFPAETIVWSPESELPAEIVSAPRETWELRGIQKKITKNMIHG
ncbi:hypothetical protein SADUNF_Sadunf13G0115500 [Salix dunnii]|uniref:Uncharacterized protein n=1 Tax=Salix dunnii TaxID=1413687 RepID=A0A835JM00_9ROSI|nr:hypothetical protein SADUNF_Sadunf13G0115500 [Salix dunnii]